MTRCHSKPSRLLTVTLPGAGLLLCASCATWPSPGRVAVVPGPPPPGADSVEGVQWVRAAAPTGGVLTAAVARPPGRGPHPVLVILHGTHGFAREYVALARDLARVAGLVAVAPCWFAGRRGASVAVVAPVECPDGPPMADSSNTPAALAVVSAVVEAARALPDVRADRVALLGHSRGAAAALYVALERGGRRPGAAAPEHGLRAIDLDDGPYPPSFTARATELRGPRPGLHGTADASPGAPPDGGSEMTRVGRARAFEAAARAAGRSIDAEYFEGANHVGLFTSAEQRARSVQRVAAFLRTHGVK